MFQGIIQCCITDGRQIDPKLIRVVPVLKRISNVVPKPPSQAHLKRIIGCSWSAFRGKLILIRCAERRFAGTDNKLSI